MTAIVSFSPQSPMKAIGHPSPEGHSMKVRKKGGSSGGSASLRIGKLDVAAVGGEEGAAGRASNNAGNDEGGSFVMGPGVAVHRIIVWCGV
eukprot:605203-Pelagomonas_calceolata.AAC.3